MKTFTQSISGALVVTFLFLGLIFESAEARAFTNRERLVLLSYDRTLEVFQYAQDNIDESRLSWADWMSYRLLKRSCVLVDQKIAEIKNAADDFPDQSESLSARYAACAEGVLSTVKLYIDQR